MPNVTVNQKHHDYSDQILDPYANKLAELTLPLQDLFMLMDKTFFLLSSGFESPAHTKNKNEWDVIHFLFARGMKTYRSIRGLLYIGCDQDALALLRNLIDTMITTKYISQSDTLTRAERFRDFAAVEKYRHIDGYRKSGLPNFDKICSADQATKIENALKSYEKKYHIKYGPGLTWTNITIYNMAKIEGVDMIHDYLQAYSTYSMLTHASYQGRESYRNYAANGQSILTWAPSFGQTTNAGLLATGYILKLAETCAQIMGIEDTKDLLLEVGLNLAGRMDRAGHESGDFKVQITPGTWAVLKRNSETGEIVNEKKI